MAGIMRRITGANSAEETVLSTIEVPLKTTTDLDFTTGLVSYIGKHYEVSGLQYAAEIKDLNQLRSGAVGVGKDSVADNAGRDLLERYFVQLNFLQNKFEKLFSDDTVDTIGVVWSDTFTGENVSGTSLILEQMAVAFNLGAVEANLGRQALGPNGAHKADDQGLKQAVGHFQKAAGMHEIMIKLIEAGTATSGDISKETISVLKNLMLAQAQECVLTKALGGASATPSLLARIAQEVAELYDQALTAMLVFNSSSSGTPKYPHPWELWMTCTRVKAMHYRAYAQYLQSKLSLENTKYGEEIGRLQTAKQLCESMAKIVKGSKGVSIGEASFLPDLIEERLTKAMKDNEVVYRERIVTEELLDPIEKQSLVRPQPFHSNQLVNEIFKNLIPLSITLENSRYTEERDTLFRTLQEEVFSKDIELDKALGSMGYADESYKVTSVTIPPTLFQKAAILRNKTEGTEAVEAMMAECCEKNLELSNTLAELTADLDRTKTELDAPVGMALVAEIHAVKDSLKQAKEMDDDLAASWKPLQAPLALLSGPVDAVVAAMPGSNPLDSPVSQEKPSRELESLLASIQSLKVQRLNLMDGLKKQFDETDLTDELVAASNTSATIAFMIDQHKSQCVPLADNLSKQDELVKELVETNAGLKDTRQHVKEQKAAQYAFIDRLTEAYQGFFLIRTNAQNGRRYYEDLKRNMANFKKKLEKAKKDSGKSHKSSPRVPSTSKPETSSTLYSDLNTGLGNLSIAPSTVSSDVRQERGASASQLVSPLESAVLAFQKEVDRMEQETPRGESGYMETFSYIKQVDIQTHNPSKYSVASQNKKLNRYRDILPADHSRVRLQVLHNGANDYINATYLKGLLPGSPDYIACQGPKDNTVSHFWTMAMQQRVRVFVMVTNVHELGRKKCEKYWPNEGEISTFPETPQGNPLDVTCISERSRGAWIERQFVVTEYHEGDRRTKRQMIQFHFTAWPDKDVPSRPHEFILFLHAVMAAQHKCTRESKTAGEPKKCPLLVHCSAGVGRTGTFIAIYSVLNSLPFMGRAGASGPKNIDVIALILNMRSNRRHMCQTLEQLIFIYRTIHYAAHEFLTSYKERANNLQVSTSPPSKPSKTAASDSKALPTVDTAGSPSSSPTPESVLPEVNQQQQHAMEPGQINGLTVRRSSNPFKAQEISGAPSISDQLMPMAANQPPNGQPGSNDVYQVNGPVRRSSNPFKAQEISGAPSISDQLMPMAANQPSNGQPGSSDPYQINGPVRRSSNPFKAQEISGAPSISDQPMPMAANQPSNGQPGSSDPYQINGPVRRSSNPFKAQETSGAPSISDQPMLIAASQPPNGQPGSNDFYHQQGALNASVNPFQHLTQPKQVIVARDSKNGQLSSTNPLCRSQDSADTELAVAPSKSPHSPSTRRPSNPFDLNLLPGIVAKDEAQQSQQQVLHTESVDQQNVHAPMSSHNGQPVNPFISGTSSETSHLSQLAGFTNANLQNPFVQFTDSMPSQAHNSTYRHEQARQAPQQQVGHHPLMQPVAFQPLRSGLPADNDQFQHQTHSQQQQQHQSSPDQLQALPQSMMSQPALQAVQSLSQEPEQAQSQNQCMIPQEQQFQSSPDQMQAQPQTMMSQQPLQQPIQSLPQQQQLLETPKQQPVMEFLMQQKPQQEQYLEHSQQYQRQEHQQPHEVEHHIPFEHQQQQSNLQQPYYVEHNNPFQQHQQQQQSQLSSQVEQHNPFQLPPHNHHQQQEQEQEQPLQYVQQQPHESGQLNSLQHQQTQQIYGQQLLDQQQQQHPSNLNHQQPNDYNHDDSLSYLGVQQNGISDSQTSQPYEPQLFQPYGFSQLHETSNTDSGNNLSMQHIQDRQYQTANHVNFQSSGGTNPFASGVHQQVPSQQPAANSYQTQPNLHVPDYVNTVQSQQQFAEQHDSNLPRPSMDTSHNQGHDTNMGYTGVPPHQRAQSHLDAIDPYGEYGSANVLQQQCHSPIDQLMLQPHVQPGMQHNNLQNSSMANGSNVPQTATNPFAPQGPSLLDDHNPTLPMPTLQAAKIGFQPTLLD